MSIVKRNIFPHSYSQYLIIFIIIIIGVAIFYGNTLKNGWIHDDHGQVESNIYIHSLKYLPKVITGCIWESAIGDCKASAYYRPTQNLSYLITYQISSKPWIFHLANLIYFTIGVFLVFVLIKLLTKNFLIALFSSLLFLTHPLNTEVVNWIATVPELLYTIFILLATIFYFLYRDRKKRHYLIFVYILYGLGIFSKEPAVFLPFIFLTLDLTCFKQKVSEIFQWKNLKPYIIYIGIFLIYMALRLWVLGGLGTASTHSLAAVQYVYIFLDLFSTYIQKLFWPHPLNLFYTFHPIKTFIDLRLLIAFFIIIMYAGLCLIAWKKMWFGAFFSIIWFLVFLLPSLIFINSIGENLFAERHVFASTIGFTTLVALLLNWLWEKGKKEKTLVVAFLVLIFSVSFVVIYQRNLLWKNDTILYTDTLKYSPDAELIRYNLALVYRDKGELKPAKDLLMQVLKHGGTWIGVGKVYNNIGEIYRKEGNFAEALKNYQASIKADPYHKEAYNNLGAMSVEKGYLLESLPYLCKAIQIDPNFKNANTNFDYAASRIQGLDNKSFMALYDQILKGDIFKASSNKDLIIPKAKDCSLQQGCLLTFNSQLPKNEFLFPFMIVGLTPSNEVVRIRYSAFNPQTSEITLGVDHKFGNSPIHLYFPACGGIYYETEAK